MRRGRRTIAPDDLEQCEVNVDRMPPAAAAVLERPDLGLFEPRLRHDAILVPQLAIDDPTALAAPELEQSTHARRERVLHQRIAQPCRHEARVRSGAVDVEAHERRRERRRSVRPATVVLPQPVLEHDLRALGNVAEIHDDLDPLGRRDHHAAAREREFEEPALGADLRERLAVGQEQFVETRIGAIEDPEAILPALDAQERLHRAVHQERVAEEAVVLVRVVEQRTVAIEHAILNDQPHVVRRARQLQPVRAGTGLIARIVVGIADVEPGQPAIDILRGEIHEMVVIPERALRLARILAREVRPREVA